MEICRYRRVIKKERKMAITTNRPGFHQVKIEPMDDGNAVVYVDDLNVNASKVDVHMEQGMIAQTDIRLIGEPDMEYESLVTFDFDPKTVRKAVDVLKIAIERKDFIACLGLETLNKANEQRKD